MQIYEFPNFLLKFIKIPIEFEQFPYESLVTCSKQVDLALRYVNTQLIAQLYVEVQFFYFWLTDPTIQFGTEVKVLGLGIQLPLDHLLQILCLLIVDLFNKSPSILQTTISPHQIRYSIL